ncbi:wall-associated protein [Xanthomonas sp. AmX2]|uniref:RHS repeat-associated core domain-containing protein n=1 Tax=Xanthomonas sp. TaxID=29446 RepID=UPI00197D34EC|nr:RHS repeat-associated core domain-containing protein [Xanthomonas sp.]MBN6149308.1 wall-associated protein [Xanthomonas sp.]
MQSAWIAIVSKALTASGLRAFLLALVALFATVGPVSEATAARAECPDGTIPPHGEPCDPTPLPQLSAIVVSQSVPVTMVVGQSYSGSVVMQNKGNATWSASRAFNLGSQNPGDNGTWGLSRVAVPSDTATGAQARFDFAVRAPTTPGTYNFQWRMVQDGVAWFGALTPNQSITVLGSNIVGNIDGTSGSVITGWACSTHLNQSIDVHMYLGGPSGSGTFAGGYRADRASDAAVASACSAGGGAYRFAIPITEDLITQHGGKAIYIHGISPVGAAHATIGGSGNFRIPAINRNAEFVAQSVPSTMEAGQSYPVTINMRNTGNVTWKPASGYVLGSYNPLNNGTWGTGRAGLSVNIQPGQTATISFNVRAPAAGSYNFQWQMLQEGVAWFGPPTSQAVTVMPANQPPRVALTSPRNGVVLPSPADILVRADASDPEGGLARVDFYVNDQLAGSATSAPYQITLTQKPAGSYRLRATARDNKGLSADSATITANVLIAKAPSSLSRRYVYDQYRQLCKVIEPETGATVMAYDAAGNLAWSASGLDLPSASSCDLDAAYASGRRVDRTYDLRNRLAGLSFPDQNGNQTWRYTPDGLPSEVTTLNDGGASRIVNRYVYNTRRLLTGESIEQPGWYTWGVGYGYDGNGHLASQAYPTGFTVIYAPNALGQPTAVRDTAGGTYASGIQYHPNGAARQFTYGNGVVHTLALNARQMPLQVRDANVAAYEYRYDAAGNVAIIYDQQQGDGYSRSMSYDGLDRLTAAGSASFGGDHWHRYVYDALDNVLSARLGGVRQNNYWYDASNRLTNVVDDNGATTVGLAYDVQGNLRQKNGQVYAFDTGNRLRDVPGVESYRYDAQGRRVNAIDASGAKLTSVYTQGGQLLYEERRNRGGFEYVYLGGSLLATRNNGTTSYQHTDALGSPVAVTNTAGQVTERTQYEPYGAAIGKTVDGIGYTGHVMDAATGLTYMQQRYYDAICGCFLSVDPVTAYGSGDWRQFNRYAYAYNNPYRFTDPDGRQSWEEFSNAFMQGASEAAVDENRFPYGASATTQAGYSLGVGMVRGGQKHAGVRVPALRMGIKPAINAGSVHGNSSESSKPQHRYIIKDKDEDVVKTGISGRILNQDGSSGRANSQVNSLNKVEGAGSYSSEIVEVNIPGRAAALSAERSATTELRKQGNTLRLQQRPKPDWIAK